MRWLEEIRVRTQPRRENEVSDLLLEAAESVNGKGGARSAEVFSHHSAPGDLTLILSWETPIIPFRGSEAAMLIVEGIKPLGLVDHMVLIPRGKRRKAWRPRGQKRSGDDPNALG
jgi:hypothetical protein